MNILKKKKKKKTPHWIIHFKIVNFREFPSGPVVRTPPFHCWESRFILIGELRSHRLHGADLPPPKKKKSEIYVMWIISHFLNTAPTTVLLDLVHGAQFANPCPWAESESWSLMLPKARHSTWQRGHMGTVCSISGKGQPFKCQPPRRTSTCWYTRAHFSACPLSTLHLWGLFS